MNLSCLADERRVSGNRGAHGDGPEGQLIPGQQVAGEAGEQREQKSATPITQLNSRGGL